MKMKMKFVSILNWGLVQNLCIKYNWCTKMTIEEFDEIAEIVLTQECESAIQTIAPRILSHSNTDLSINEIAGELFRNAVVRYVNDEE